MRTDKVYLSVIGRLGGIAAAAFLLLATIGPAAPATGQEKVLANRIVAEVNDDIITLYELNQAAAPFVRRVRSMGRALEEERKLLYEVREQTLNQLIEAKLTDQEIRRYNITVSTEAIDNAVEEIKKRSLMTDQQLRATLQKEGMTMDDYREQVKNKILRSRLVNRQVKSKIVITDEDIRAAYEEKKAEYGGDTHVRLRQIVVIPSEGPIEAQQRMQSVLLKLDEGLAFADVAREFSDGPTAADGGFLGEFKVDDLSDQIRGALKGLKTGDHTSILETGRGLQLFYVDDIRLVAGKSLEEAAPEIEDKLYDQIVNRKFADWLAELRERSHIRIIR
ncbi:MAG: SurA N-terminal domain-containing protein [Desulfobacterales bacterium]|nr:SurA N-terminal domain-containing protein [Desulfobacterales bacterium]